MAYGMTQARRDPIARLDAWVIEELEALSRTPPKARRQDRPRRRREDVAEIDPDFAEAANDGPLPMDENQFIQRVSEWLSGRPNADLILEEIWRNVVVPEVGEARADAGGDDALGDDLLDEALSDEDLGDPSLDDDLGQDDPAVEIRAADVQDAEVPRARRAGTRRAAAADAEAPEGPAADAEPQG